MKAPAYSIVILGGGIHGCMFFINLPPHLRSKSLIIDNNNAPLARFKKQCKNVGVHHLRSPASHHLHADLNNLFLYAHQHNIPTNTQTNDITSYFAGRYYTPRFDLFIKHSFSLLTEKNISSHWRCDFVNNLSWDHTQSLWNIHTDTNSTPIYAKRIIFALGADKEPDIPFDALSPHHHILHPQYTDPSHKMIDGKKPLITVIGSGMSGTQCALRLAHQHKYDIHLVGSHKDEHNNNVLHRINDFDSKPCFIGPRCLPQFLHTKDYSKRKEILKEYRYPGTVNSLVEQQYKIAEQDNIITPHVARVKDIIKTSDNKYILTLSNTQDYISDFVICATGYHKNIAHKELITSLAKQYSLPLFREENELIGTPIVSPQLEWLPLQEQNSSQLAPHNLYITGSLAELELGPASKNIIGAHLAYRRLSTIWHQWN